MHVFRNNPLNPIFARRGRHSGAALASVSHEEPQIHDEEDDVDDQTNGIEHVHYFWFFLFLAYRARAALRAISWSSALAGAA
jgi:hypothetical protein